MKKTLKQKAFTLAETLIVMGVIGVVAALTIPSLSNSTNDKDTVTRLRKAHAALEDAFGRMIATNGEFETWGENLETDNFAKKLIKSMKISKDCDWDGEGKCFKNDTLLFHVDSNEEEGINGAYSFILADGTTVGVQVLEGHCTLSNEATLNDICGTAIVDVDGAGSGKNTHGADLFMFYITKKGFYPVGMDGDKKYDYAEGCTLRGAPIKGSNDSKACTAWVIYNGNMDYKKANSDGKCISNDKALDFSTNTSCD